MFNINEAVKFKYIHNYRDMRGGYEKLSGVVRELSGRAMEEGTAYVFTSRNQKLVKVVRHENNECQRPLTDARQCIIFDLNAKLI